MKGSMLLAVALIVALASSVFSQAIGPTEASFEVATIKLQDPRTLRMVGGSCHGTDTIYPSNSGLVPPLGRCLMISTLSSLVGVAYSGVAAPGTILKIGGGPAWVDSDFWVVEGKAENTATTKEAELTQMLRTLLLERFSIEFHHEMKDVSGFALLVAKGGLKIVEDHGETTNEPLMRGGRDGTRFYRKAPLSRFANYLSALVGEPVIDKTGLVGPFSFEFHQPRPQGLTGENPDFASISIFTAIREQLGLRLEPLKVPADYIVIDHVERPAPN